MVERYEPTVFGAEMVDLDDGDYVAYTDYAALEAENASLRARIEAAPHSQYCATAEAWAVDYAVSCDCWKSA